MSVLRGACMISDDWDGRQIDDQGVSTNMIGQADYDPNKPDNNGDRRVSAVDSDNLDYSVTLDYQLAEDTTVYARYATGYKAAGVDRRSLGFVNF